MAALTALTLFVATVPASLTAPVGFAAPAAATPCAAGTPIRGDYDGDGRPDLLVGVDGGGAAHPDGVGYQVIRGSGGARTWLTHQGPVRNADLNGDVCADAVIWDSEGGSSASLVFGTRTGLNEAGATELEFPQAADVEPGGIEELDLHDVVALRHHGISQIVVSGTITFDASPRSAFLDVFTLDARGAPGVPQVINLPDALPQEVIPLAGSGATVAVGLYERTVSGKAEAGGVLMLSYDTDRGTMVRRTVITQNSPGVPGSAEAGDHFGEALDMRDGRLAVGIPREANGKVKNAGAVQPIRWNEAKSTYTVYRQITQGTRGVVGTNETGDRFGTDVLVTRGLTASGSYDIAIYATESVGKAKAAGSVTVANFTKSSYRTYTQNSRGIAGTAEKSDRFGSGLGVLRTSATTDTLLIGAAGERGSTAHEVGYAIRSDGRRLSASTKWTAIARPAGGTSYLSWGRSFAR